MNTICYYISDYGFGHAARSVAIIRELLTKYDQLRVIICHSFAIRFIKESLANETRVEYRVVQTDIGYVLRQNSLEPDINGMNSAFNKYMESLDGLIRREVEFCKSTGVKCHYIGYRTVPF